MKESNRLRAVLWCFALALLILDTKTAVQSAFSAVDMCIRVLIPSLFPFFVVSSMLTGSLQGLDIPLLKPLGKLLRLPKGGECLFLVGILGGYPVGAAAVAQQVRAGNLQKADGKRLLAFCSNAGPSFIFGIGVQLFSDVRYCWIIWGIHILSAILVGLLTPGQGQNLRYHAQQGSAIQGALKQSLAVMANVCAWVVLFRVLMGFLDRWVLWLLPDAIRILICGLLELANGSASLPMIGNEGLRLFLFSIMLSFGGCCVWMQTISAAEGADSSLYFPGKLTQTAASMILASGAQFFLPAHQRFVLNPLALLASFGICLIYACYLRKNEKRSGNSLLVRV